jgi:hypothetical protein
MKYLALLSFLLLAGCHTSRRPPELARPAEAVAQPAPTANPQKPTGNLGHEAPKKGLIGRIFSPSKPETGLLPGPQAHTNTTQIPRKCKGCVFNTVAGNQANNTAGKNAAAGDGASTVVKPDAPVATNGATSQDFTKQGQRGGAAASGPGSTATATTIKPPTPWLKYGLWLAGAGLAYWVILGGGGAVLLALVRRKSSNDTTS